MERLSFYYDTLLTFSAPVAEHDFLLRVVPPDLSEQRILEYTLITRPLPTGARYGTDAFGNRTYAGRIARPHTLFRYTASGVAVRDDTKQKASSLLPAFRYPSRLTEPTEALQEFLSHLTLEGTPFERADRIGKAVHAHFTYTPGVTNVTTTADEAFRLAKGVCQDYTHVFLTLARLAGIPARYVSGLPKGDGASHAWAEVWDGGFWHGVDSTRDCPVDEGYLKICTGRDFADCPVEAGLFSGFANQQQKVYMKVSAEGEQ